MTQGTFRRITRLMLVLALVFITSQSQPAYAAGTWFVAPTGDDNSDCLSPGTACATINGAMGKAFPGETIYVAVGTYHATGSEVVLIDKDITLSGGWDAGFVSQDGMATIDGEAVRRGITVNNGAVTLEHLTIQNGFESTRLSGGGGIFNDQGNVTVTNSTLIGNTSNSEFGGGGGIYNNGTLILNNSAVIGNHANGQEGGGAGIYNRGTMTLNNSSVSDNNAATRSGGGIFNQGTLSLNNTTVGNNIAFGGAGIYNGGTLDLNSSTVSYNTAISTGGIFIIGGTVTLHNSILAANQGLWPDCAFPPASAGYNIIGNATTCNFSPTTGDQVNIDPKIGLVIGHPGYDPLFSDSPAIDAGDPAGCMGSAGLLTTDQRGAARTGICDIGAYEYTTPGAAAQIYPFAGTPQHTPPLTNFWLPLQAAVLDGIGSPVSNEKVIFTAPGSGASGTFLDQGTGTTSETTDLNGIATAAGFSANDQTGSFTVTATVSGTLLSADFSLSNLTWYVATTGDDTNNCQAALTPCQSINGVLNKTDFLAGDMALVAGGIYTGSDPDVVFIHKDARLSGGWEPAFGSQNSTSMIDGQGQRRGLQNDYFATSTIDHFTIQNGSAGAAGGIWNNGTLTVNFSTIKGNTGLGDGGGILNLGILTLNDSSVIRNHGDSGGGISNGSTGSAILATAYINNSTLSGNSSGSRGGGIGNPSAGTLYLNNATVSGNQDAGFPGGGGIYNEGGHVTAQNSILAGNVSSSSGGMDCSGTIISFGYNLIGNTSGCTFTSSTGDLTDIDPNLGQLIGPSNSPSYHPLLAGSPAIDAGNPAGCTDQNDNGLTTDQRGLARVGTCDMGAYEFTVPGPAVSLSLVSGDNQSTSTTHTFPKPLQAAALDNVGSPVSGIAIDFAAPGSGASGTFADTGSNTTSVNTDAGGVATTSIFTANDQEGTYLVSASATGLGSLDFPLEQITRPANDNFADATIIESLPFHDSLDSTKATLELNEPNFCGSTPQTQSVWYSFTPSADIVLTADMTGSSFGDANLTIFKAVEPGFGGLNFLMIACGGGPVTFHAQAGTTYYLQAGSSSSGGGDLHLNLVEVPPPANDNFASATPISVLPLDETVETAASSVETGEPRPSCVFSDLIGSVWYAFTASASGSVSASASNFSSTPTVTAYTGNSFADLNQVGCQSFGPLTFHAEAGVTYYLQVSLSFAGQGGPTQVHMEVPLAPVAGFFYFPIPPSVFDTIQFIDNSFDPGQAAIQTFTWNFGDGSMSTDSNPAHQYSADGDYTVEHSITTSDGRSASTSQLIQVRTHDVSITKITAPKSAKSGQTKTITVSIRNTRYPETVRVDLFKTTPEGDVFLETVTLQVPAPRAGKTTQFNFHYTFTSQDAQIGQVSFRAVASIQGLNDAHPVDNEAISSPPTTVNK
jgi:PKD domain-containing protein